MPKPIDMIFPEEGKARVAAQDAGLCVKCQEPALPKCYTELGKKEYGISGLCEVCWDYIMQDMNDEGLEHDDDLDSDEA